MLSYREATTGAKPVDWYQELTACNPHDYRRLSRLTQLAVCWAHCPVGALSNELCRDENGEPLDTLLSLYGNRFSDFVANRHLDLALETWKEIQVRALQLLPHAVA